MNGRIFETWVKTQLAPTLSKGDIVNLFHVTECQNFFKAAGYEAE